MEPVLKLNTSNIAKTHAARLMDNPSVFVFLYLLFLFLVMFVTFIKSNNN